MPASRAKIARSLDWNLLKIFYEISEAKGVTSAANILWRKQSTISLALKRLELEVGTRLCSRGAAGFELTDEGRMLMETCKKVYESINEIPNRLNNISEDIHGQIRFTTISNISSQKLDELILAYNQQCPFVEIIVAVAPWEKIPPSILRNQYDIGVTPINVKYPELQYHYLCEEHHRIYCGSRHQLFGKNITNPAELSNEPLILTGDDEPEQLTKFRLKHGIGNKVAASTSHLEEAMRLASLGIGICILPEELAKQEVADQKLWPLTPRLKDISIKIYIVTHVNSSNHLVIRSFTDLLDEKSSVKTA